MRRFDLIILDVALLCLSAVLALALRENFEISYDGFIQYLPYFCVSSLTASCIFFVGRVDCSVWRYQHIADHVRLSGFVAAAVFSAVCIVFVYNRLDGLARSLPILHLLVGVACLSGARIIHKLVHDNRQHRKASESFLRLADQEDQTTVLIIGISKLTEAYLQALAELAPGRIKVAGLLGLAERHRGRLVAGHQVLGAPEEVETILDRLEVHGVSVERIVVATPAQVLTPPQREALLRVQKSRSLSFQYIAEDLGLNDDFPKSRSGLHPAGDSQTNLSFEIDPKELRHNAQRFYWKAKRAIDCCAAFVALALGLPLMAVVALCVAASVGFPVIFWQKRPGLGGRPFWVCKFRTMKSAYDFSGRKLSDDERVSRLGSLLRRFRFDELPQLWNVFWGDMAIIGPRPLLPCDQSDAYRSRLLVRPGLTGWAQVVGGRVISPEDKAALDVWYVRNACLSLDIEIAMRTVGVVLLGERPRFEIIERAWLDLGQAGVIKGELALRFKIGMQLACNDI